MSKEERSQTERVRQLRDWPQQKAALLLGQRSRERRWCDQELWSSFGRWHYREPSSRNWTYR